MSGPVFQQIDPGVFHAEQPGLGVVRVGRENGRRDQGRGVAALVRLPIGLRIESGATRGVYDSARLCTPGPTQCGKAKNSPCSF